MLQLFTGRKLQLCVHTQSQGPTDRRGESPGAVAAHRAEGGLPVGVCPEGPGAAALRFSYTTPESLHIPEDRCGRVTLLITKPMIAENHAFVLGYNSLFTVCVRR